MNLVFIGSSRFGLRCLETAHGVPAMNVTGIVTVPKTFDISYRPGGMTNSLHADVVPFAASHRIPVRTLDRSMNERGLLEEVAQWKPDAFLVVGWYHMIPRLWRDLAPAYGMHASLLPDYSGGAPLVWAMINGESKTGITMFKMGDGVDSGPIAGQKQEPILPRDTITTLYSRIEERGIELLCEVLPLLSNGSLKLYPQDESRRRRVAQRGPEDGEIDWKQDAVTIDRFIRAQTRPYPGAFTFLEGKPLQIWRAGLVRPGKQIGIAGHVERYDTESYSVRCGDGAIRLKEISYEAKTYFEGEIACVLAKGGQYLGKRFP